MKEIKSVFSYLLIIALCMSSLFLLKKNEKPFERKEAETYIYPPESIEHMVLGYNEVLADSLWLRWIQSIDLCGKNTITRQDYEKKLIEMSPSAEEFKKAKDLVVLKGHFENKKPVCNKGWSFKILKAITYLAPKFILPYTAGASALSVITEDHLGAKSLFDRGNQLHPDNWRISFYGAYHYLYELYNVKKAADLMLQSARTGGQSWFYHLASSLYTQSGQAQLGLSILKTQLKNTRDKKDRKKILEKIEKLKKSL